MRWSSILAVFLLAGCADAPIDDVEAPPAHDEPSDLVPFASADGKADSFTARFDREWVMSDAFLEAVDAVDANAVQAFLEMTPYGTRSWLADEHVGGTRFADSLVAEAHGAGLNPIVLLGRAQVESGLVSKTERPNQTRVDFAMGCGCPDHSGCSEVYRGLDKQMRCGADTLRKLYDQSVSGEGQWRAGKTKKTLDPFYVTPANHATAAHYGYTPWVLPRRGGNWLVWNVTKRFTARFEELVGPLTLANGCNGTARPFIGDACGCDADCAFHTARGQGFCHDAGFCTVGCEGPCPDLSGRAGTFCVADGQGGGMCVPKSEQSNGNCADVPGTRDLDADRYVGASGASESTAEVCLPQ